MIIKLKEIAQIKAGNSAPKKDSFSNSGIPFIRAGSLEFLVRNQPIDKCEKVGEIEAKNSKLKLFPKGSILFAKSGMSAKMGRVYQLPSDAFVVSHLAVIVPNEAIVTSSFLKYYFIGKPPLNLIRDEAYPSIKLTDIEDIELDLPDIETQNKIVAILDKANTLVQKRQQTFDLLNELLRSQFLEMFGDPVVNPKNWATEKLSNLGDFKNGLNYSQSDTGYKILCLGVGDFKSKSRITPADSLSTVNLSVLPTEDYFLKDGDLVFVRSNGNKELVGRCVEVFPEDERISYSGFCIRFRIGSGNILSTYLNHALRSPSLRRKMLEGGRGANISNINQNKLGKLEIPIPNIEIQQQYVDFLLKLEESKNHLEGSQNQIQVLFNSILQKAFTGKLNLDVSVELSALLEEIDLQKSENDLYSILSNEEYVNNLVERLNKQNFENQELYDKAKHAAFQLLKTDEILAQKYDEVSKSLKLVVK